MTTLRLSTMSWNVMCNDTILDFFFFNSNTLTLSNPLMIMTLPVIILISHTQLQIQVQNEQHVLSEVERALAEARRAKESLEWALSEENARGVTTERSRLANDGAALRYKLSLKQPLVRSQTDQLITEVDEAAQLSGSFQDLRYVDL
jgi:hypothetical protein